MNNNLRFELSFKNIFQLDNKLNFCKLNKIKNINIPCKGIIKKEFFDQTIEHIQKNYREFNVFYHYSLQHQYDKNIENSYKRFLYFINKCNSHKNSEILLVSGTNKKKNFDVIRVLNLLKKENLNVKLGVAYNPYLNKYSNTLSERERYGKKVSSGLVKSIWLQFGTDIELLEKEVSYLKKRYKHEKVIFFGSIFIPSKQFIARFKFRPWKAVFISEEYLYSLENFYGFTKDLINFYIVNEITPVIETDFCSAEKLETIESLFNI